MTDPKAILDRVEKLDKAATPGPWNSIDVDHGWTVGKDSQLGADYVADVHAMHEERVRGDETSSANADLISEYRTLAPKLALALRIAVANIEACPHTSSCYVSFRRGDPRCDCWKSKALASMAAELEP